MIAFLGTGLLGSNFVKRMLQQGQDVQVWNRTESKARALENNGAKCFTTPAEAVRNASYIHLTLSDDQAVDDVLDQAKQGMQPGAIIIDHTTTTKAGAIKRMQQWKELGFTYVHAPVFMGPVNALEASGYMLISGDQNLVAALEPRLAAMTGKLVNLGAEEGKAAALKLVGNLFLITLTAGLSDTMTLASALNITGKELSSLFDTWNPGSMVPARLKRMMAGKYDDPSWELNMARKDARLMLEEAAMSNVVLGILPSIAANMDQWIEKGMGNKDWTVIGSGNIPSQD